jgi:hypothetical protein
MTDTQRMDFLEETGANVVGLTDDALVPTGYAVCVSRVTGWHRAPNLRDAIDACERDVHHHAKALNPK